MNEGCKSCEHGDEEGRCFRDIQVCNLAILILRENGHKGCWRPRGCILVWNEVEL